MGWQDDFQSEGQRSIAAAQTPSQPVAKKSAFDFAKSNVGLHEARNEAALRQYLYDGGKNLSPATRAWCADFVNASVAKAGGKGTGSGMARSFLNWGQKVDKPQQGDVAVFSRNGPSSGQGHVGFFDGYDKSGNVRVLGGNQGNRVQYSSYPSSRVLGFRRGESAAPTVPFTPPETVNNEGVVSTASSMLKSPPPATPGSGFANVAMNNNIISEAPMPMTSVPGQPTAPMPVVKPASSFASNMPVYGQTPPDKAVRQFNERTGTMMHPTAGREVLHMGGLTPEQQRDTLQGAFDRGNKDMLYVHDSNPRVVAKPGEAKWAPGNDPKTAGPEFANTFQVANGYGTNPRPMADSNPLKGSRYDDGTATGTLPAPPAGMMSAPPAPSSGPPASSTPVQAKSQPAIIAQATPPTEAPPPPPPGPTAPEPPKSMLSAPPQPGRMALGAGDVQPVQPPPPPSGAPAPVAPPAQPQATGPTPAPQPANIAKPKPPGGMLSAPPKPKGPEWGMNNGQMGVTWKNGLFSGFGG